MEGPPLVMGVRGGLEESPQKAMVRRMSARGEAVSVELQAEDPELLQNIRMTEV